ncbi:short-chain dehydrogenase/reductase [Pleomorphomonas diazotrophica]|uniref:Short-chain dehydrogenase/reductase n=1 Tax=Pleomorphomonas diazotrophica TaxID=1166257 RepID=A0A1I4W5K5_9HYPH|nr:SDR family oxidoreductase [Pleomorphomonas diazotrophica]PKR87894.1 short-chain dehydrogenase/reductase [Pleomorphomonas diazotrophica]SFN08841.1 NADP-dependent 3-hydroxy acid dehydrogenase YdfG [Pleomorphomonas diazotrophica]
MPAIFITGCSSGFGLETARLFLQRGWDVVATMRTLNAELFPASERLRLLRLDVTDAASAAHAVAEAGPINVLVNNAGFGVPSPVELTEFGVARAMFETNTLGTLAIIQALLPSFRQRRSGVIINVSSSTTLKSLPMVGVYRATKAAVNSLTETLALEVKPFGVRTHLVIPGSAPETRFGANGLPHLRGSDNADYAPMIERIVAHMRDRSGPTTRASDVAAAIWRCATDPASPFRLAAGRDAEALMAEAG